MAYLIYTQKKQLLFINYSAKSGLYSQTLSPSGLSRPLIIHRNHTSQYSATIDQQQDLHIITQPSSEQIIHLHYKDNQLTRNIILEDPKGIYHFSNLHVVASKEHVHLFYTANQPIGDSCDLIHHILCSESKSEPYPIMSFSPTNLGFRYMTNQNVIYILYSDVSDQYNLYLMSYENNQWAAALLVSSSAFPIDDFQFCMDNLGTIHLVYVQEKYGRYHLLYKRYQNGTWCDEILLHTTSSNMRPSIFTYHRGLWVTYVANNQLQMILSMDGGNNFSQSVACSAQAGELERCNFVWAPGALPDSFNGNMLYTFVSSTMRIGVISPIDMIGLHPDMAPNTELELFLDGVYYSSTQPLTQGPAQTLAPPVPDTGSLAALQEENEQLKQTQEQMIAQYNEMAELTKKIQEEGKKWRDKALVLEKEKNQEP